MLIVTSSGPAPVAITLPLPPSANDLWVPGTRHGALRKSDAYNRWLVNAGWHCVIARAKGLVPYRYHLRLTVGRQAGDLDNRVKALGDLLQRQGIVTNDRHMERFAVVVGEDHPPGSCTVELWPTDEAPPAPKRRARA